MISIGSGGTVRCVSTLNGVVIVGKAGASSSVASDGIQLVNFIEDGAKQYNANSTYTHKSNISDRNAVGYGGAEGNPIINHNVNDVAMTVLPNAPIDADTGLPVPTIAVATNGGVSIIKDDGSVVDITQSTVYNTVREIDFTYENKIIYTMDNAASRSARVDSIPNADFVVTSNQLSKGSGEEFYTGKTLDIQMGI